MIISPDTPFVCLPCGHWWRSSSISTDKRQFREQKTGKVFQLTTQYGVRCLEPVDPDHKLRTNRCCTLDLITHGSQITQSIYYTCVYCGTQWKIQGHQYSPAENIYTNVNTGDEFELVYAKNTIGSFLSLKLNTVTQAKA
jgi:hypothetical protein